MNEFSCGKTAKSKGKRGIVIGAIAEDCVVPGSTEVIVGGQPSLAEDYQRDINHFVFENWLRSSIPHMKAVANRRPDYLVIDNGPYHSYQIEQVYR